MIGFCRSLQRTYDGPPLSDAEIAEALRLARQALESGKDDPDVLWMAGDTLLFLAGEHATAQSAIDRALMLNPNSAHAWMASGWVSGYQNQPNKAIEALQRAMRLSPLDPLSYMFSGGLAFAHVIAERYEEALEWADRCLQEQPRFRGAVSIKIVSCDRLGRIEEARDWLSRMLELSPGTTIARWANAMRHMPPEILAIYVESFRKAGLPEE
jgi:adenylate cyclase